MPLSGRKSMGSFFRRQSNPNGRMTYISGPVTGLHSFLVGIGQRTASCSSRCSGNFGAPSRFQMITISSLLHEQCRGNINCTHNKAVAQSRPSGEVLGPVPVMVEKSTTITTTAMRTLVYPDVRSCLGVRHSLKSSHYCRHAANPVCILGDILLIDNFQ